MSYVRGFVLAVPAANKDAYLKHASAVAPVFRDCGATRLVAAWGDEVPDGKLTDFRCAVQARPDEVVVFTWLEFPDKATADAANQKSGADPRSEGIRARLPFDGQRMIYGGFSPLIDDRSGTKIGYVDGTLIPVPDANKQTYLDLCATHARLFKEYGATRVIEGWGIDVPDGKVTDFRRAVKATADETVVYGWIEWPSKQVRDDARKKLMADQRMHSATMPFDGKRMIYGGFSPILDA